MAAPSELSVDAILKFMLANGGRVTNHDLVKHFKKFLTDPETRDAARNSFKEYVNTVATIRNEQDEKYLVLKKKYRQSGLSTSTSDSVPSSPTPSMDYPASPTPEDSSSAASPRQPPPYRPPPEPTSPTTPPANAVSHSASKESFAETVDGRPAPQVPPRRKSSDKLRADNKENIPESGKRPKTIGAESGHDDDGNESEKEEEKNLSVKEKMKNFNRLASQNELSNISTPKKEANKVVVDDDDNVSVTSDPKAREWLVHASQANYQALAKLASDNPRLAKLKDPANGYTGLHWAAKHGNENIVKLLAGTYKVDPNGRTSGGYTPLHMAMMFGHEDVFNLLVKVYSGNPNLRDWSGRRARQYLASQDTSVSADTFRKLKARRKQSEKDLGFLRIGSLNVRVKKTTKAFSNFLGLGTTLQTNERLHKTWGSADNIQQVGKDTMPPPKFAPKKRKSKQGHNVHKSYSTPNTPPSHTRTSLSDTAGDSDSDNACGFYSNWKNTG